MHRQIDQPFPAPMAHATADRLDSVKANAGFGQLGLASAAAVLIAAPILIGGGWATYSDWAAKEAARRAIIDAAVAHERLVEAPAGPMLAVEPAAHGRDVFATVCFACHGPEGKGLPGLGRDLTVSDFVAGSNDDAMLAFLISGRPDAKPAPMPPRGGRPDLTDADLHDVVVYLRGLQDPRRLPALPAMVVAPTAPTETQKTAALAAAGGDAELAEYIASGMSLYAKTCAACHGPDARGLPNLGKDLTTSQFVHTNDDDALLAFLLKGRNPGEPGNTTGVAMPPKGGNPALTEDDLLDIIAYLRSIQSPAKSAAKAAL